MLVYAVAFSILLVMYISNANNTSHGFSIPQEVSKLGLTIMLWLLIAILTLILILWVLSSYEFIENKNKYYVVKPQSGRSVKYDTRILYNEIFGIKYKDIHEKKSAPLYDFWVFMKKFVDNNGVEILLIGLSTMIYGIVNLLYINYKEIEFTRARKLAAQVESIKPNTNSIMS